MAESSLLRFSTRELRGNALERTREEIWWRFHGMDMSPAPDVSLDMDIQLLDLPQAHVQAGSMSAAHLQRHTSQAASADMLILIRYLGGAAQVRVDGQTLVLQPGDAAVFSTLHDADFHVPSSRFYCIGLPREALTPWLGRSWQRPVQQLAANPGLDLLTRYAESLCTTDVGANPALGELACQQLKELTAFAIHAAGAHDDHGVGRQSLRMQLAQCWIERHLDRADICIEALAAHLNLTVRSVQLLFQREGTTFSAFVLEQRLTRAARLLRHPACAGHSVSRLAHEAGFTDQSYFTRRFRARFGKTPSQWRHDASA